MEVILTPRYYLASYILLYNCSQDFLEQKQTKKTTNSLGLYTSTENVWRVLVNFFEFLSQIDAIPHFCVVHLLHIFI